MITDELAGRLSLMQERVASLNVAPAEFIKALQEVRNVGQRELHAVADAWVQGKQFQQDTCLGEAARAFAKGSFTGLFSALALASGELLLDPGTKVTQEDHAQAKAAWREVCNIFEQLEPCSPNHISAASGLLRAIEADPSASSRTPSPIKDTNRQSIG